MKRYVVLKAKALEDVVGHLRLALALISLVLNLRLDCVCLMVNPIRDHDVCNILTGRPNWCLLARARERFFIVRAGCSIPSLSSPSPPFLSLPVTLSFLSSPLQVGPYSSPSLPSIPFPTHVITNVKNHNPQPPLGVGNGCVQNETSS